MSERPWFAFCHGATTWTWYSFGALLFDVWTSIVVSPSCPATTKIRPLLASARQIDSSPTAIFVMLPSIRISLAAWDSICTRAPFPDGAATGTALRLAVVNGNASAGFVATFADPNWDAEAFGKLAGKVGVTTGRLVTAGVSTIPRLLEVDTSDGVDWLGAGNAFGIELTRGIAATCAVDGLNPAGWLVTEGYAVGAAAGVVVGANLLASNELGSGGTVAGKGLDSDGGSVGATTAVCGRRGIGAETRGYSGNFGAFNTTDVASGVAVSTGSLAATLTSLFLASVFLSPDGELPTSAFTALEEGSLRDGLVIDGLLREGAVAATDSIARLSTADGPAVTFEIVSPPIRIACGIENSPSCRLGAIADCEAARAVFWSLRSPTTGATTAGEFAICVGVDAVVAGIPGIAATEGAACGVPTEFGAECDAATCGGFAVAGRSSKRVGGAISTMTDGTGPCSVGEIAATTAGPTEAAP